MRRRDHLTSGPVLLALSFVAGAIPFSGLAARLVAGVDLRHQGTGTVSGTGLYDVAGFGPLAVAGSLDVAKGALGPTLAGRHRPMLGALAAAASIAGHNWSPLLAGAGGRGISPALGATLVLAPEGTVVLGAGLGGGRFLARQSGVGTLVAIAGLFPVLAWRRGRSGYAAAAAVAVPMVAKRLLGNEPPDPEHLGSVLAHRLLFDHDPPPSATTPADR